MRRLAIGSVLALVVLGFPFAVRLPFPQHLMIMIFLYAAMAQAWNILSGYCGQISLGQAVFFGVGAYTSTLLLVKGGVSPWIGMAAGAAAAAGIALLIGYPCFRLAGHYFAIATIAVGEIVQTLFINWGWAGGAVGLYVPILPEGIGNLEFHTTKVPYYYIALAIAALAFGAAAAIERSKMGYYFRAIKNDPVAARSVGIRITRYKLAAVAVSAFLTAIPGAFYAQYVLFIDPESVLPIMLSILICLVAVLGGAGTLWGPLLGPAVLLPLSEGTRVYLGGGGKALDLMIYGALIVLISIFEPGGLMGLARRLRRTVR